MEFCKDVISIDTVRVLHQTVVALRTALEQSKNELHSLREKVEDKVDITSYCRTIEQLSIENHILRQKFIDNKSEMSEESNKECESESSGENDVFEEDLKDKVNGISLNVETVKEDTNVPEEVPNTPRFSKGDSEDSEEVDDIELIFTTDDTKELGFQEDLVSISDNENWKQNSDISEKLKQTWSQSVLVETDISKCGVIDENEPGTVTFRRNTLPTPLPYRPILHRDITGSKTYLNDKNSVKFSGERPILKENTVSKQESEAQTDITAVPILWRSESFLAHHKTSSPFTTLPSKFNLPFCQRKQSLRLCEKTQEARRVLLSDINFTSMVPELSRSADHLCQETLMARYPRAFSYMKNIDGRSPCDCGRWGDSNSPSGLDLSRRHSMKPSLSSLDNYWGASAATPRQQTWASVPSSPTHFLRPKCVPLSASYTTRPGGGSHHFDPSLCCAQSYQGIAKHRTSRIHSVPAPRQRVKFTESKLERSYPGHSLPDLRAGSAGVRSQASEEDEESTDSLIDESEDYIRRSIDSILTGREPHRRRRTHSQPDCRLGVGGVPKSATPYLARSGSEVRTGHWVKVILSDGRTATGLVRYVGPLPVVAAAGGGGPMAATTTGSPTTWLGLQLTSPGLGGNTDGTFQGARYFTCEPDCGIFVPFKKVVMAWSQQ